MMLHANIKICCLPVCVCVCVCVLEPVVCLCASVVVERERDSDKIQYSKTVVSVRKNMAIFSSFFFQLNLTVVAVLDIFVQTQSLHLPWVTLCYMIILFLYLHIVSLSLYWTTISLNFRIIW